MGSILNQVYKYGVLAVEEAPIGTGNVCVPDISIGATSIVISNYNCMSATPFVLNKVYTIRDDSFVGTSNGAPNSESIMVTNISAIVATPKSDGIGYAITGSLTIAGGPSFSGGTINAYLAANNPTILNPGVEIAIQSADFNCRFKTVSDAPKIDFDDEASRYAAGDEGRDLSIAGMRSATIDFTQKLSWGGSVTTVPVWDKLMRTMGHIRRKYSTAGIGYLPMIHANEVTATIWIINPENVSTPAAQVFRYVGCHGGNGSSIAASKVGDVYMLTAKYMGAYIGTQDITWAEARLLTAPQTTIPEVLLNNTATAPMRVDGSNTTGNLTISQFSLDFGGTVNSMLDQSTSTGIAYYATQDRDPRLSVNPYMTRKALDDFDYIVSNSVTGKVTIQSAPTTPHITIEVPQGQLLSPSMASREGFQSQSRVYRCLRNNLGSGASESNIPDACMYQVLIGAMS
jgi:hypothetical protein